MESAVRTCENQFCNFLPVSGHRLHVASAQPERNRAQPDILSIFAQKKISVNRRALFSTKILSAVVGVIAAGFWRASYKEIAVVAINAPANATERKRRKFELLIQIGPFGARLAVLGRRSLTVE